MMGMRGVTFRKDLKEGMKAVCISKGRLFQAEEQQVQRVQADLKNMRGLCGQSPGWAPHQEGLTDNCRILVFTLSNVGRHWRASSREEIWQKF